MQTININIRKTIVLDMGSLVKATVEIVVGIILLTVIAAVILTQNAATLGGALNVTIVGFITTAVAIGLMVKGFNTVRT